MLLQQFDGTVSRYLVDPPYSRRRNKILWRNCKRDVDFNEFLQILIVYLRRLDGSFSQVDILLDRFLNTP